MTENTFKIKSATSLKDCSVEMNGVELKAVRRVHFDMDAGRTTVLTLEIYGDIEVDGKFVEQVTHLTGALRD